ncbi:hypothetical protein [Companilactobacillus jidongensis]|uniref:hypothetical protein n=1 Tax=Companilactobacillus jidongensis TaxID=2486006 RepID=UPI000F7AB473|nr:hypothetical protein [Companilactobacillus jidongensis]
MADTFLNILKWILIVVVAGFLIIHVAIPLIIVAAIVGGIYYLYRRHKANQYTPEGRKKVN